MKIFSLITFLILSSSAFAFNLNPQTGRGFNSNTITINIANTSCAGAGFTLERYKDYIEDAVEHYWNAVPISALKLKVGGISSIDIDGDSFDQAIQKVPDNTILAGCNDDVTEFSNGGSPSSILGAASMSCNGSTCKAVLILNAHADSKLPDKSDSFLEAVIAHEIGHAFGLGHSDSSHSLMYFSASGKYQKWLGQDDIDGVTFLYPHKSDLPGFLGNCGTIDNQKGSLNFTLNFLLGLLLILGLSKFGKHLRRFF